MHHERELTHVKPSLTILLNLDRPALLATDEQTPSDLFPVHGFNRLAVGEGKLLKMGLVFSLQTICHISQTGIARAEMGRKIVGFENFKANASQLLLIAHKVVFGVE